MSDVEVLDHTAIVRREVDRESNERALAVMDPSILDTLFASRDPNVIVKRIADVSDVLMDAVHQRDLARRYGDSASEFLHIEAWEFLSSMLGMTMVGVDSRPLPDGSGWEATAELRHVASGRVLGRRDGMCQKTEPAFARRRGGPPAENTLRQMAQIRAARAAARSVIGFVPRIGGFEISDPDAPATTEQVGMLHQLERELGLPHDEGHALANVASYKDLNREDASTLIDRWTAMRDEIQGDGKTYGESRHGAQTRGRSPEHDQGGGAATSPTSGTADATDPRPDRSGTVSTSLSGAGEESPGKDEGEASEPGDPSPSSQAPASSEAWERAARAGVTAAKALVIARKLGFDVKSAAAITGAQLSAIVARKDGR